MTQRQGREVVWAFHAGENALDFNPSHLPPAGATIAVSYWPCG